MESKKILVVAPPFIPVSKDSFAGTEQMVYNIGSSLKNLGHDVYTVAREDSNVETHLVKGIPSGVKRYYGAELEYFYQNLRNTESVVRKFIRKNPDLDLIFDRCFGASLPVSIEEKGPPVLSGLHMESKYFWAPKFFKGMKEDIKNRKDYFVAPTSFIAEEYFKKLDFSGLEDRIKIIPNGIVTDNFAFSSESGDYLMYMGRMVERKGLHYAIKAATETNNKLLVVGCNPSMNGDSQYADLDYYNKEIEPILNNDIKFYGTVGLKEKVELFQNAKGVLFPSETEPFGLIPIESMACGTPVIAFNKGGPKETIVHGKTGFLADSYKELALYIGQLGEINRDDCRDHALSNFDYSVLGDRYSNLIKKVLD